MGTFISILQIVISILLVFFSARIATKAGYSPLWALTALIAPAYVVAALFFAFMAWPRDDEAPPDARMDEPAEG